MLIAPGNLGEFASAGFKIEYQDNCPDNVLDGNRIDIFSWTSCAGSQFNSPVPAWPAPRSGALLIWAGIPGCQSEPLTVGGYLYMSAYQADALRIVDDRASFYRATLVDCKGAEIPMEPEDLGSVVFSSGAWSLCATLEFVRGTPNRWPSPGGSNIIVWDAFLVCQTGETAVGGYF